MGNKSTFVKSDVIRDTKIKNFPRVQLLSKLSYEDVKTSGPCKGSLSLGYFKSQQIHLY